jgi:beta-lactamase regulating signal transducer with metallopeptidase domain
MLDSENGDYVIYVNDYLSEEAKFRAIEHERAHIKRGDLYSQETVINIEKAMKK